MKRIIVSLVLLFALVGAVTIVAAEPVKTEMTLLGSSSGGTRAETCTPVYEAEMHLPGVLPGHAGTIESQKGWVQIHIRGCEKSGEMFALRDLNLEFESPQIVEEPTTLSLIGIASAGGETESCKQVYEATLNPPGQLPGHAGTVVAEDDWIQIHIRECEKSGETFIFEETMIEFEL